MSLAAEGAHLRALLCPRLCAPQTAVESIERTYDAGRSLLSPQQLCVFAALLWEAPFGAGFRAKWLGLVAAQLGACR